MNNQERHSDIDDLLKKIFTPSSVSSHYPLKDLFDQKLTQLGISRNQAHKILDVDHKTLDPILSGDAKKANLVTIIKLSSFLEIPHEEIFNKYFDMVSHTYSDAISEAKKRSFIVNNFNLRSLKKIGFIDSVTDFDHIEAKINDFFGYESVFEYSKYKITAAFSSGKRETDRESLSFWYAAVSESLKKTPNPYEFDREGLVEFFPQIRWFSLNVDNGLAQVARMLFKLGVSVVFVPKYFPDIHVKGATLEHDGKPCIALTQYTNFYATIWFTLIHELFHVLYDWEHIQAERFHITGETTSMKINEEEADHFARQYLLSDEKMDVVKSKIQQPRFVQHFAEQNHIHQSIIYSFYCRDTGEDMDYSLFSKYMSFNFSKTLEPFKFDELLGYTPIKDVTKQRNLNLYNSL